jgi:predicted TIM-barrel fold metal-dependent hydrolase
MYEKARDLGISLLQFHKGIPLGNSNVEDLRPNDIQRAARDFPDMNFVIYHLAVPYFAECVSIAARFPNVYLALGGNIQYGFVQPRVFHQQLGELLLHVGADKLFFGSEAPVLGGPEPYIDFLLELEIPEDLQENFGYPEFTLEDKRKMLGENFARVLGYEIPSLDAVPEKVA